MQRWVSLVTVCFTNTIQCFNKLMKFLFTDFKNVSIVGHYVKDRTKDAQFIIIRYVYFGHFSQMLLLSQLCTVTCVQAAKSFYGKYLAKKTSEISMLCTVTCVQAVKSFLREIFSKKPSEIYASLPTVCFVIIMEHRCF